MKRKLTWSHFCEPSTKKLNLFLWVWECKGVVFYFFLGEYTNSLTQSFSRFAEFFFTESRNLRLIRFEPVNLGEPPSKWPKKWSYVLHFQKNRNSAHAIAVFCKENGYRGFTLHYYTIRICFFRQSWEWEKIYRYFHSHTPFLKLSF